MRSICLIALKMNERIEFLAHFFFCSSPLHYHIFKYCSHCFVGYGCMLKMLPHQVSAGAYPHREISKWNLSSKMKLMVCNLINVYCPKQETLAYLQPQKSGNDFCLKFKCALINFLTQFYWASHGWLIYPLTF